MTRQQAARIAALDRWSREDPRQGTLPARRGFLARFEDQVDPDRKLSDTERRRRAQRALRAHMRRLAQRSAEVRRRAK